MYTRRIFHGYVALGLLAWMMLSSPASATTLRDRSIEDIRDHADVVIRGRVIALSSRWIQQRIVTDIHVRVDDVWIGDVAETITVRIPGGTVGTTRMLVADTGEYRVGDDVVLFLQEATDGLYMPRALALSLYHCRDGLAVRDHAASIGDRTYQNPILQSAYSVWRENNDALGIEQLRARVLGAE